MEEQELRSKEDRRKDTERRKVSDRRKSNVMNYELLNFERKDKRNGVRQKKWKRKKD